MTPGVVMVWSGTQPRSDVRRIPAAGLELGRDGADATDDRISRRHLHLRIEGEFVVATDLESRNGSFVNGERIPPQGVKVAMPAVFRIGRTVGVVVGDVAPHDDPTLTLEDGPVLERARRQLEEAARAEVNVTIEGAYDIAMPLARKYAEIVGGETRVFDARASSTLDSVLTDTRPRTVILALTDHAMSFHDMPTILAWLETDVRFVTIIKSGQLPLSMLEPAAVARLRQRVIGVWPRFERIASQVLERTRAALPNARIHATVPEAVAIALCSIDQGTVDFRFGRAIEYWQSQNADALRGDVVHGEMFPVNPAICLVGDRPRLRRRRSF